MKAAKLRSIGAFLFAATLQFGRFALADDLRTLADYGRLTKSDIPANLSPDLRELIEGTFSENVRDRERAVGRLGELHERAAPGVPFLMRLLARNPFDQVYVDDALVAISAPALKACIADANVVALRTPPPGRHFYDRAIGTLGAFKYHSPEAVDALLELLKAPDSEIQRQALVALDGGTDTRATLHLLDIAENSWDSEMRMFAVYCFKNLRDPRCVEPLLKIVRARRELHVFTSSYSDLVDCAVNALGWQRDRRAVPALLEILNGPKENGSNRLSAAQALGYISDPSTFKPLADVLMDRGALLSVRTGAALGLGFYRAPAEALDGVRILSMLSQILSDEEEPLTLRISAAKALGESGNPKAVQALCALAESKSDTELRFWSAASAIKLTDGRIADMAVASAIQDYQPSAEDRDFYAREEKRTAMAKLGVSGHLSERAASDAARDGLGWLAVFAIGIILIAIASASGWLLLRRRNALTDARR